MSTLGELICDVRDILDDHVEPPQFSDARLTKLFNEAVLEACIRTHVIQDMESSVCSIALEAGTATYTVDPCIFAVRRARVDGQFDPLELLDTSQLDCHHRGWDDPALRRTGIPCAAMFDAHTGRMTLVPTPNATGTLRLLVWRGPTEDERFDPEADETDIEPPLPQHMHRELKHWVAGQALLDQEAETYDPSKAANQLQLFEDAYGRKPTLHEIRLWSTNKRRHVRASFD